MTLFAALALVAVACGAEEVAGPGTTHVDRPGTTTTITLPGATQQELLAEARLVWATNRPDSYELTYVLDCECDSGPWYVQVEGNETVLAGRVVPEPGAVAPYQSVEAIFTAIEIALADTEFPVDVEYDENLGYPRSYIYNEPGLAYDAGFVLEVTGFEANPSPGDAEQREAFANALRRWETAGIVDYEYQFTRNCFCPREFTGPYAASVQNGEVTLATLDGVDLFDIEMLEIGRYDEIIQTVDDVFAEVERALREADSFNAEYHPQLGYPTEVWIDWDLRTADEEVGYVIRFLADAGNLPDSCSTDSWEAALVEQPDLPEPVARTRAALFDAAMNCDFASLMAISNGGDHPVETSFGGSGAEVFAKEENRGVPAMRRLVEHLNLGYASDEPSLTSYVWPAAFDDLTSPYGDGISAADYAALLELYTVEGLEESFASFDGFAGYRVVIGADGQWLFAIAGD